MRSQGATARSLVTAGVLAVVFGNTPALAQDVVKVGFSAPITGPFAENGKQMSAALKLFIEQNGTTVAGKKIEVILRDDGGVADQAKRIAQQLVVESKVAILAGYNPTPAALAVAPIATEAKIPQVATGSSASITTQRSPYIVRTFSTQP
jgi:branched-chain amino acid transport system substrate-binding protein